MKAKLKNIMLMKTSFEREGVLEFEDNHEFDTSVNITYGTIEDNFLVVEFEYLITVKYKKGEAEYPQFNYSSTHVAQFELIEHDKENKEELKRFANINAAAIIYPFIRENAATISSKAGMSPIMIPVTNFVALYEKNKENIK